MGSCVSIQSQEQDPILGIRLRQACIDGDIRECERACKLITRGPGGLIDEPEPDSSMAEHAFFFDIKGQTALHLASTYGREACVKLLLDRGASTNIDQYGRLPCHLAAENGHMDCLKLLLSRRDKIDPNIRERVCGRTMLHLSAYIGSVEQVKYLLAMPSIRVNKQEMTGSTALHFACAEGNDLVLAELLGHHDTDVALTEYVYGHTALHKACIGGYPACVKPLLERSSIDINQGDDEFGRTAAHWAAQSRSSGALECLELLLSGVSFHRLGASSTPSGSISERSHSSVSSFRQPSAASMTTMAPGKSSLAKIRSSNNIDASATATVTATIGTSAAADSNSGTARVAGEAGGDGRPVPPEQQQQQQLSGVNPPAAPPVISSSSSVATGRSTIMPSSSREVRRVCDLNREDFHGRTCLIYAAQAGNTAAVKLLLERGADANKQDKDGMTALLIAASNNRLETLSLLLQTPFVLKGLENSYGENVWTVRNMDNQTKAYLRTFPALT